MIKATIDALAECSIKIQRHMPGRLPRCYVEMPADVFVAAIRLIELALERHATDVASEVFARHGVAPPMTDAVEDLCRALGTCK